MRTSCLILLAFFGISLSLKGQISYGGTPYSFKTQNLKKSIAEYSTPNFDYQQMRIEDERAGRGKPYRYGKEHKVILNPENSGTWQTLANGDKIWQLKIKSSKAYSVSLVFNNYHLNNGSKLFLYSPDEKILIGAFTEKNNKKSGWFSTVPIAGEEIIIELNVPFRNEYGQLQVSTVIHDYRGTFGLKTGFGASGSCNINVNCPEGVDWQIEKRAVAKFIAGGSLCTGALINNTANDAKPYFLTAHHCLHSSGIAAGAVFWFNYESDDCVPAGNPSYQSISSSNLIATGENTIGTNLDFTLLELSVSPPTEYNVYYAGWNRKVTPATNTTCIHHPEGDIKKISFDSDAPEIGNYDDIDPGSGYLINSHWKINEWNLGTTEGGSSGSPLFDENHMIIGDLTGGLADCSNSVDDYYTRFDLSWDYHSDPSKHLKSWLDPVGNEKWQLEGFDPNAVTEGLDASISNINSPNSEFCAEGEVSPKVVLRNNGTIALTSALISYQIDDNQKVFEDWNGSLGTNDDQEIIFKSIIFPSGKHTFKAFVSSPNGSIDQFRNNDTIIQSINGHRLIEEVVIDGSSNLCAPELKSTYQVVNDGNYLWKTLGGGIVGSDTSQQVEIQWDDWGVRSLDVNVSNLCNSVDAETFEIDVVEQGINLDITLEENGETACWYLKNCDGDIVAQDCDLPSSGSYTTTICVSRGCYTFEIVSETLGIKSYSLIRLSDGQTIVSGQELNGSETVEFILNASNNNASFNLYPNPSKTEIALEASFIELYENSKFAIFNLRGSTIAPYSLFDERKVIDISTLSPGFYIIKILTPYGEFSKKFLKP